MLGALRDRVMLPDGTLVPWRTEDGTRLRLAASAPVIPWSDLVSAAAPNGKVSATRVTSRRRATDPGWRGEDDVRERDLRRGPVRDRARVSRSASRSSRAGRWASSRRPCYDPEADVASWVARTDLGEPYTDDAARDDRRDPRQPPLRLLPARRPPARAAPPVLGLHRRPVPGRRGAARSRTAPASRFPGLAARAPSRRLRPPAGRQQAGRARPARPARSGAGSRTTCWASAARRAGRTAYVQTCPRSRASAGPVPRALVRRAQPRRRARVASPGRSEVLSTGGDPAGGDRDRSGHRRR